MAGDGSGAYPAQVTIREGKQSERNTVIKHVEIVAAGLHRIQGCAGDNGESASVLSLKTTELFPFGFLSSSTITSVSALFSSASAAVLSNTSLRHSV